MGQGQVGCCKVLGAEILCLRKPDQDDLQQKKCYSLFGNFFSLYDWKHAVSLKSRQNGLPCVFQAIGII